MKTPILAINGKAGVGKDAVASTIGRILGNTVVVSMADPIKRFAMQMFDFTPEQLWGPSRNRNAVDERYGPGSNWDEAFRKLSNTPIKQEWAPLFEYESVFINKIYRLRDQLNKNQQGLSPRILLQFIGTEAGRAVSPNMWIDQAKRSAKRLLCGGYTYTRENGLEESDAHLPVGLVIIPDCRFRNEVLEFQTMNARVLRVVGDDTNDTSKLGIVNHPSEVEQNGIPDFWFDYVFQNPKTGLAQLEAGVVNEVLPALQLLPRR